MKRMYASGSRKRAEKSRKIDAAAVGTPSINSFFNMQISSAAIPVTVAEAVVEHADTAEENVDVSTVSPVCSDVLASSKEKADITSDITSSSSSTSDCDLFRLDRSFPTDQAHFPATITSASLKSMILSHGPCHPSGPFEEDGTGRPVFSNKHY